MTDSSKASCVVLYRSQDDGTPRTTWSLVRSIKKNDQADNYSQDDYTLASKIFGDVLPSSIRENEMKPTGRDVALKGYKEYDSVLIELSEHLKPIFNKYQRPLDGTSQRQVDVAKKTFALCVSDFTHWSEFMRSRSNRSDGVTGASGATELLRLQTMARLWTGTEFIPDETNRRLKEAIGVEKDPSSHKSRSRDQGVAIASHDEVSSGSNTITDPDTLARIRALATPGSASGPIYVGEIPRSTLDGREVRSMAEILAAIKIQIDPTDPANESEGDTIQRESTRDQNDGSVPDEAHATPPEDLSQSSNAAAYVPPHLRDDSHTKTKLASWRAADSQDSATSTRTARSSSENQPNEADTWKLKPTESKRWADYDSDDDKWSPFGEE